MRKKLLLVAIVLFAFCFATFARNRACVDYDNNYGVSVFVESWKDPNDTDITIQDYINKITVISNGNKMVIRSVKIKNGRGQFENVKCPILGEILEPYGAVTFTYKTHDRTLSSADIEVKTQGCN